VSASVAVGAGEVIAAVVSAGVAAGADDVNEGMVAEGVVVIAALEQPDTNPANKVMTARIIAV
jgi:hypothetical protein